MRDALRICTLLLALAPFAPAAADPESDLAFPRLRSDAAGADGQDYSYYFVPRLNDLNHFVGTLFGNGHVRVDEQDGPAVARYAAYSCQGTLFRAPAIDRSRAEDIDWSTVTELRSARSAGTSSLVISRDASTVAAKPIVLYFNDQATGYYLHQALAVLVGECHRRTAHAPSSGAPSGK